MSKSRDAFRTISEVADLLETPAHVLRFWESKFTQVKPVKRAGGRRYYRPGDITLLAGIKRLLHEDGMTIKGVQKVLREQGVKHVTALGDLPPEGEDAEIIEDAPYIEVEEETGTVLPFAPQVSDPPDSNPVMPATVTPDPAPPEPDDPVLEGPHSEQPIVEQPEIAFTQEPVNSEPEPEPEIEDDTANVPEIESADTALASPQEGWHKDLTVDAPFSDTAPPSEAASGSAEGPALNIPPVPHFDDADPSMTDASAEEAPIDAEATSRDAPQSMTDANDHTHAAADDPTDNRGTAEETVQGPAQSSFDLATEASLAAPQAGAAAEPDTLPDFLTHSLEERSDSEASDQSIFNKPEAEQVTPDVSEQTALAADLDPDPDPDTTAGKSLKSVDTSSELPPVDPSQKPVSEGLDTSQEINATDAAEQDIDTFGADTMVAPLTEAEPDLITAEAAFPNLLSEEQVEAPEAADSENEPSSASEQTESGHENVADGSPPAALPEMPVLSALPRPAPGLMTRLAQAEPISDARARAFAPQIEALRALASRPAL